nr:hypothetical protein HmN_000107100 [Hymenolepis microstoma]
MCGLRSEEDADIRLGLLNRIEHESNTTPSNITSNCHQIVNLQKDTHSAANSKFHAYPFYCPIFNRSDENEPISKEEGRRLPSLGQARELSLTA